MCGAIRMIWEMSNTGYQTGTSSTGYQVHCQIQDIKVHVRRTGITSDNTRYFVVQGVEVMAHTVFSIENTYVYVYTSEGDI